MSSSGSSSSSSSSSSRSLSVHRVEVDVKDFCTSNPEPPRPPIAPKGEVVLLVGPASHEIRVHALVLSNASRVFASMLRNSHPELKYSESAAVLAATSSSPARIPLPEDDPAALETICRVLHNRTDPSLYDLSPQQVLSVAIAADKYDCAPALALAVEHWLSPGKLEGLKYAAQDDCIGFRRGDLLLASYWFQNERVFKEVTRMLICEVKGGYEGLAEEREGVEELLAWKLALALESRRNSLRLSLYAVLMEHVNVPFLDYIPGRSFFGFRRRTRFTENVAISKVLRSIDREVFSREISYMSISGAVKQAVEVPALAYNRIPSLEKVYREYAPPGERGKRPYYKVCMEKGVNEWKREVKGLCLACLHEQMVCDEEGHRDGELRRMWRELGRENDWDC
ncbi:btb poz-like protein [Colletotrichum truncatum]|uniref:Btb poz-like protein n=1 Tax=Colletotrichum truncatum TaxID=5467 RepID=A0ACC3YWH8_COLTU